MGSMFNDPKFSTRRLFFDGNSLTEQGAATLTGGQRYPITCYNSLVTNGRKIAYFNYAVGGLPTPQLTTDFNSKFATLMLQPNDIVVFWEITNDAHNLTTDTNGTQLYNNVVAYCNQAKNAGAKVVVLTGIARDMTGYDDANITDRIFACNALIRANYVNFADRLADVAQLTQFDEKADVANTTYYNGDRVHLTNAGYDLIAGVVQTEIEALL